MGTAYSFNNHVAPRGRLQDSGSFQLEDVWERAKKALRRDWDQTKYDLSLEDGLELNQDFADTIQQILGQQRIPRWERPNPQKLRGHPGQRRLHGAVWPRDVV